MTRLLCRSQPIDWSRLSADPVGLLLLVGPWSLLIISNRSPQYQVLSAAFANLMG